MLLVRTNPNRSSLTITETCAIVIARIASILPNVVVPYLETNFRLLCIGITNTIQEREKIDGLRGLYQTTNQF